MLIVSESDFGTSSVSLPCTPPVDPEFGIALRCRPGLFGCNPARTLSPPSRCAVQLLSTNAGTRSPPIDLSGRPVRVPSFNFPGVSITPSRLRCARSPIRLSKIRARGKGRGLCAHLVEHVPLSDARCARMHIGGEAGYDTVIGLVAGGRATSSGAIAFHLSQRQNRARIRLFLLHLLLLLPQERSCGPHIASFFACRDRTPPSPQKETEGAPRASSTSLRRMMGTRPES